jgi:hypothetical protein
MVTPIITTIKNIIDDKKDKDEEKKIVAVDASKFIRQPNHHYPIQNLDSIEEDTNTTTGSEDIMFSDDKSLSLDRSTNIEEKDKNKKF